MFVFKQLAALLKVSCTSWSSHLYLTDYISPMFVERKVCYSALFRNLVKWHIGAVSFPLSDVILAQLACPRSDVMFCLHSGITNLSLYKPWLALSKLLSFSFCFQIVAARLDHPNLNLPFNFCDLELILQPQNQGIFGIWNDINSKNTFCKFN